MYNHIRNLLIAPKIVAPKFIWFVPNLVKLYERGSICKIESHLRIKDEEQL